MDECVFGWMSVRVSEGVPLIYIDLHTHTYLITRTKSGYIQRTTIAAPPAAAASERVTCVNSDVGVVSVVVMGVGMCAVMRVGIGTWVVIGINISITIDIAFICSTKIRYIGITGTGVGIIGVVDGVTGITRTGRVGGRLLGLLWGGSDRCIRMCVRMCIGVCIGGCTRYSSSIGVRVRVAYVYTNVVMVMGRGCSYMLIILPGGGDPILTE